MTAGPRGTPRTSRFTHRDYLRRARRILGMRWSYARVWTVLWEHTGFPFVGLRATLAQVRQWKRGACDCPSCRVAYAEGRGP